MDDRCPTDVYYEFHGMGADKLQLRPCALLGWAYCNGHCNDCQTTATTHTPYEPIEIARQYAPKFDKPVVDMVAVVRCKDCRYYCTNLIDEVTGLPMCGAWAAPQKPEGYCNYGAIKDEVEECQQTQK